MSFLIGLLASAETAVAVGGIETAATTGLEAVAQEEMMTTPEGMIEQAQESGEALEQKEAGKNSKPLDVKEEFEKHFLQQQFQEAEKRRKEVENDLNM